jgi:NAD(P)-dependent dehydrogenase (short-subunit alcohol dehydrogenase family)/acyl carrier protein
LVHTVLGERPVSAVALTRRDRCEVTTAITALAELFVHGTEVDWTPLLPITAGSLPPVPTTVFQRQHFWLQPAASESVVSGVGGDAGEVEFWRAVQDGDLSSLESSLPGVDAVALTSVLPVLARWRNNRRDQSTVRSWGYQVDWERLPHDTPERTVALGRWLVLLPDGSADGDGGLVAGLRRRGAEVETASLSADRAQLARRVTEAGVLRGVLCVGGEVELVLAVLQTLLVLDTPARVWCVSRGAVATGRSDPVSDPRAAQVWGLGRVVALEHPDRWGGLLDLPASLDARALDWIATLLVGESDEDQVAVRSSGVFGRRLVRIPTGFATVDGVGWRPRGTVLITGGTGGLGGHVARWAAGEGAQHLVLVSRRGPHAPGAEELSAQLTASGVRVSVVACDLADRDAVAEVLAEYPPDAVVHAAGVPGVVAPVVEYDPGQFAAVLAGKVSGTVILDELLGDRPLDAFVLFSSVAGVWGSAGQAAYAAGNAFLDALAQARRDRGRTALAIAWGPWAGGGMAETGDAQEQLRRLAFLPMQPRLAIVALREATRHDRAAVVITAMDWAGFAPMFASVRPTAFLRGLSEVRDALEAAQSATQADLDTASTLRTHLTGLDPTRQITTLTDLIRTEAGVVLGGDTLSAVQAFRDAGFDSLTAVELRNRLTAATGVRLPVTAAFDYPTPTALAEYLHAELMGSSSPKNLSGVNEHSLRRVLTSVPLSRFRELGVLDVLLRLAGEGEVSNPVGMVVDNTVPLADMDLDELVKRALDS